MVSIVLSMLITTIALSRMLTWPGSKLNFGPNALNSDQNPDSYPLPLSPPSNGQENSQQRNNPGEESELNEGAATTQNQPSAANNDKPSSSSSASSDGLYGGGAGPEYATGEEKLVNPSTAAPTFSPPENQNNFTTMSYSPLYQSSPYIVPITWGAVAGTLIWRGKVRSQWCKQGYDYDTFRLLARMRGSPIRVALLTSVTASAKTRSRLAEELCVDWKTIDNHVDVLARNRLVQEIGTFGTSRYFAITEHGRRVLSLLLSLEDDNDTRSGSPNDIARTTTTSSSDDFTENREEETEQSIKSSLN